MIERKYMKDYDTPIQIQEVDAAVDVYKNAAADLGPELSGFSIVDLLADNFPWSITKCREIAKQVEDYTNNG
jgi:hypothetical protein